MEDIHPLGRGGGIGPPADTIVQAARAVQFGEPGQAEQLLRVQLAHNPDDPEALRLLATIAMARRSPADAERMLRRAIQAAPNYALAYADLVSLLSQSGRGDEALSLLQKTIELHPQRVWPLSLKAAVLTSERRIGDTLDVHEQIVTRAPEQSVPWMNYGHALKTTGRLNEAVAAYRRSLEIDPTNGFAWWGLANLRTVPLEHSDIALLEAALRRGRGDLNQAQVHFALGKALGDHGQFERSFRHYERANELRQKLVPYDALAHSEVLDRAKAMFTPEFVGARAGLGCRASDVIFIVGMPRSGSSLVEQILASHPMIEGLGELPELPNIVQNLEAESSRGSWPESIGNLPAADLRARGERYLESSRRYRRTSRPYFTDKMPSNWQYIGLIQLILPNAKVIDVRRDPVACCFSNFTTYFAAATHTPNTLMDVASQYCDYIDFLCYFDITLPGRIHRVLYERLIDNLEQEVQRLLAHLDLPFNEACLRFNENSRPVDTPSSEQVRRPLNREGLDRWRHYEPWLTPLRKSLGRIGTSPL